MLSILSFIFGASIGSFAQVIASRLHVAPFSKGRSKCLSCGEALRPSDLVPVFSYIFLRGKCRYCKTRYGVSALVIECVFGISFLLLYLLLIKGLGVSVEAFLWLTYYTALFLSLGVMALYDRVHSYIPTTFLLSFFALSLVMLLLRLYNNPSLLTLAGALSVTLPFLIIWLVTKGKGVGFGDVILFFCVGLFFGALQGFAVIMLSVWSGAVYGIFYKYIVKKNKSMSTPIPFVPFIVISFLFVLFTGIDIFSIARLFA